MQPATRLKLSHGWDWQAPGDRQTQGAAASRHLCFHSNPALPRETVQLELLQALPWRVELNLDILRLRTQRNRKQTGGATATSRPKAIGSSQDTPSVRPSKFPMAIANRGSRRGWGGVGKARPLAWGCGRMTLVRDLRVAGESSSGSMRGGVPGPGVISLTAAAGAVASVPSFASCAASHC
jgi:hypothetical protein